jgi:hypothetical protein
MRGFKIKNQVLKKQSTNERVFHPLGSVAFVMKPLSVGLDRLPWPRKPMTMKERQGFAVAMPLSR